MSVHKRVDRIHGQGGGRGVTVCGLRVWGRGEDGSVYVCERVWGVGGYLVNI